MEASTCTISGCDRAAKCRDMCSAHYERWRKHGDAGTVLRAVRPKGTRMTCAYEPCGQKFISTSSRQMFHSRQCWSLGRNYERVCTVDGCDKSARTRRFCGMHQARFLRSGDAGAAAPRPSNPRAGQGYLNADGYRIFTINGRAIMEHRLVMEGVLGRPLMAEENVHHINGQRADNRPENLELWSSSQPPGQRVTDKVAWAVELLELYAPELLAREPVQLRLA